MIFSTINRLAGYTNKKTDKNPQANNLAQE
ncbi:MAG: hypothetical protein ACJASL_000411 [Paraglaciecola sp.]|jgi:hypothetical protein